MNITRIRGTLKEIVSFSKVNTLNRHGQANLHLIFPEGKSQFPTYPQYDLLDYSGRVDRESSATKVTHLSTIMTLGN